MCWPSQDNLLFITSLQTKQLGRILHCFGKKMLQCSELLVEDKSNILSCPIPNLVPSLIVLHLPLWENTMCPSQFLLVSPLYQAFPPRVWRHLVSSSGHFLQPQSFISRWPKVWPCQLMTGEMEKEVGQCEAPGGGRSGFTGEEAGIAPVGLFESLFSWEPQWEDVQSHVTGACGLWHCHPH